MFHAFIFSSVEMGFISIVKSLCVLDIARTQSNMTVQRAFVRKSH